MTSSKIWSGAFYPPSRDDLFTAPVSVRSVILQFYVLNIHSVPVTPNHHQHITDLKLRRTLTYSGVTLSTRGWGRDDVDLAGKRQTWVLVDGEWIRNTEDSTSMKWRILNVFLNSEWKKKDSPNLRDALQIPDASYWEYVNVVSFDKGDSCLIGESNLEFHWVIYWNLVNSFEAREDDCQLCHSSMVVFLLSSFLFVYAIVTRFE